MPVYIRKRKSRKRKLRGVTADVKTVVALLVMVGLGFSILYMIISAASYTLSIYGKAVNDTIIEEGKEALAQVSSQAMSAVSILLAIPLIIAAVLIIKYITSSFGFDFGFGGRWYRRALIAPIPLAVRP